MEIKTISQLTPLEETINNQAYFGISQYSAADGGKYLSRKLQYTALRDQLSSYIDTSVLDSLYKAKSGGARISISGLRTDVNNLKSSSMIIGGVKTFSSIPKITATIQDGDNNVPNVGFVKTLIDDKAGFIAENQYLPMDPGNGSKGYTVYDGMNPDPKQLYWRIDHNQRDSSKWLDEFGVEAGPATCLHTGNLVCYGWLADNGDVKPEQAWVGLFGHVQCGQPDGGDPETQWVALQIQPWIVGKYSSTAQYVSFNIPVKAGLQLKIMTGFNVNGNNTGLTERPTLMFAEEGNMPNAFVGYILRVRS